MTRKSHARLLRDREDRRFAGSFTQVPASLLREAGLLPPLPEGTVAYDVGDPAFLEMLEREESAPAILTAEQPDQGRAEMLAACLKTAGPMAGQILRDQAHNPGDGISRTIDTLRRTESEAESDQDDQRGGV
jgi:hypothetical protein